MKKLFAATLAVALVFGAGSAVAQSMAVQVGLASGPYQTFYAPVTGSFDEADNFKIGVLLDTGSGDANAAEFILSPLPAGAGLFTQGIFKFNDALDLGNNAIGEYILSFKGCFSGSIEMLRIEMLDFSGKTPQDMVMTIAGIPTGTFGGELGVSSCASLPVLTPMGGTDGGTTGADTFVPDGAACLNPVQVPVDAVSSSMGQLKGRF